MSAEESSRRRFLRSIPKWCLSLWGLGFAGVIISYLRSPLPTRSSGFGTVKAGSAETLAPGTARLVRQGDHPLYVIRLMTGELTAVSALCTHYRCVLNWNPDSRTLVCPCHDGVFNPIGQVLSGMPTRDLETFLVDVRIGEIVVHVGDGV